MNPFSITYNGITIQNGTTYTISLLDGVEGIPIRTSEDLLTGGHGGNIWASKYDMRTIAIEGVVYGVSVADYFAKKNALVNAFSINTNNTLTVTMWDGTTRTIEAHVIDSPIIPHRVGKITYNNFRVEVKCPYPFWSDDTVQTETCGLRDSVGFPLEAPLPLPLTGSDDNVVTINNNGTVDAYAQVRFSNAVTNPTITNVTTGKSLTIETTLLNGEYIDIYVNQNGYFVMKDDGSNYMEFASGTFPIMIVGNNELRFTAQDYSATAEMRVIFSSKYITI